MVSFRLITLIIYILLISNIHTDEDEFQEDKEELIFVYEHSRHGKRTPVANKKLYNKETKTDIFGIKWNKEGELTNYGKLQHYFIGLRNKHKYKDFIDFSHFKKSEILARTTGVKRSTASLYYQLLGMYSDDISNQIEKHPISEETVKNSMPPNIKNWKTSNSQYIKDLLKEISSFSKKEQYLDLNLDHIDTKKFHITKIDKKYINANSQKNCKNHNEYIKLTNQRKKYKEILNDFTYKYYSSVKKAFEDDFETEKEFSNSAKSLAAVFISAYEEDKKELKLFYKKSGINPSQFFSDCLDLKFFNIYHSTCNSKSCIMAVSRYMKKLIDVFERVIKGKKGPKMIIDLGHDVTVNFFQVFMQKVFGAKYGYGVFGTNLFFELYRKKGNYFIEYYENDKKLAKINYYEFKKKVKAAIWSEKEIDDFCNGESDTILSIHSEQDKEEDDSDNDDDSSSSKYDSDL